jgi:hypothetical protein
MDAYRGDARRRVYEAATKAEARRICTAAESGGYFEPALEWPE